MRIQEGKRAEKLMVCGRLHLARPDNSVMELRRGMAVKTREGREAGLIAAVILDETSQTISHVLLCHLPVTSDYRLIPVNLITQVVDEAIYLNIARDAIDTLAVHQAC